MGGTLGARRRRAGRAARRAARLVRRDGPLVRAMARAAAPLRAPIERWTMAAGAVRSAPKRAERQADLERAAAARKWEPRSGGPSVAMITAPGLVHGIPLGAAGIAPERIAREDSPSRGAGPVALGALASAATEDLLCFITSPVDPITSGWLARLADALTDDVVAATPTLVHPERPWSRATEHDLLVRSEGYEVELDELGAPRLAVRGAGDIIDVRREPATVVAAPLQCLVVRRSAYEAAGGLGAADDLDAAAADLCARLAANDGRVVHVPGAALIDHRAVASRAALRFPIDPGGRAWRWFVDRHGPWAARRAGATSAPRWVITTAVPSAKVTARWGDWHLAEGLAGSLRRRGQDVHVQTLDRADTPSARSRDLHLVVRGLAPVRRTPGQRHVLWVVSHPESLEIAECDEADLVLVASARFADSLRERTSTPVEVFLQATDAERFRPTPSDPAHRHPVTIVAKTRDVMRPIVTDALAAGIRPAIYGGGWRDLIDPRLVVSDHVDNDVLPVVYSGAGVVLNDHWDTMRTWGFVSNRIFDVLACGTPIISDDLPEIHELFGDAVPTYRTPDELGELVRDALEHPADARARADEGRALVLGHHTFDHRAQQLLGLVAHHGLSGPPV